MNLIARQPILNNNEKIFGYEFLFRSLNDNDQFEGNKATASVITGVFNNFGIKELTGDKKVFINFTDSLLQKRVAHLFPSNSLVVEILEDVIPEKNIISVCKELKDKGYLLALDDFQYKEDLIPFLDIVDIIKIDFLETSKKQRTDIINKINNIKPNNNIDFLAEKIETREDFNWAHKNGYKYFQGFYFSKPDLISSKSLPEFKANYYRLLRELNKDLPDFKLMEKIIKSDVSLAYGFLQLINSAYFGFKSEIKSIKQALVLLGINNIKRWVFINLLKEIGSQKPDVLIFNTLIRAKFAENLAPLTDMEHKSFDLFMMGMLSMLDAFLDRPLKEIIGEIDLNKETKNALLKKEGEMGVILDIIINYEKGKSHKVNYLLNKFRFNIKKDKLSTIYLETVDFVHNNLEPVLNMS